MHRQTVIVFSPLFLTHYCIQRCHLVARTNRYFYSSNLRAMPSMSIPHVSKPDLCYFTFSPPTYWHFSVETPLATPVSSPVGASRDPSNPLLSYRQPHSTNMSSMSNLMRLQTASAHGQPTRPRPVPQQNVLHVTSDDSVNSDTSSSSSTSDDPSLVSPLEHARCSRCHRTPSVDLKTGTPNMIRFGLNSYYCTRCAGMVGLTAVSYTHLTLPTKRIV